MLVLQLLGVLLSLVTCMALDHKLKLIVDFDETITEHDTMAVLGSVCADWNVYVDAYMDDLQRYDVSHPRNTLSEEYQYLENLKEVELRSVQRIEDAGVFKGITMGTIKSLAEQVQIRDGFTDFAKDREIEILSVNWSSQLIQACVDVKVTANSLIFENGVCTGHVTKSNGISTAIDKLDILKGYKNVVYIGDSMTDLPCLLHADIGIIIGTNKSLKERCEKYEIEVRPIDQFNGKGLYRAITWREIDQAIPRD